MLGGAFECSFPFAAMRAGRSSETLDTARAAQMASKKRARTDSHPASGTHEGDSSSFQPKSLSGSTGQETLLTVRRHNEEQGVSLTFSDLVVFGRSADMVSVNEVPLPPHVESKGLTRKPLATGDEYQSGCHAFMWYANGSVRIRPVEKGDAGPKRGLLFARIQDNRKLQWSPDKLFDRAVSRPSDISGDCILPLDADYLAVRDKEEHFLRIEWKYNELLCFACSPQISPLAQAGSEITEVRDACQWGRTVELRFGGTLKDLEQALRKPTRRFLFAGHADASAKDGSYTKTLGFTQPGGALQGGALDELSPATDIAKVVCKRSTSDGGMLELVFINGCCSEGLGRQLWQQGHGVGTVVCWKTASSDAAAHIFCVRFFVSVAGGADYKTVFAHAVMQVVEVKNKHGKIRFQLDVPPDEVLKGKVVVKPEYSGIPLLLLPDGGAWSARRDGALELDSTTG